MKQLDYILSVNQQIYPSNHFGISNLVLSGGGIKGFAHIGVLSYLENINILSSINIFAGSSIGAIICFLHIIGYKPSEMLTIDFCVDTIISGNIDNFSTQFSYNDTNTLIPILERLCDKKNINHNITFWDLYRITNKILFVTTTCLSDNRVYYMSHLDYPNMSVIYAVCMSANLPILFPPMKYKNKLYIDGGFMDNYPIHLFPKQNTIGAYLIEDTVESKLDNCESFLFRIFQSILTGNITKSIRGFENNTIQLHVDYFNIFSFEITNDVKNKLYNIGYELTSQFFLSYKPL